MRLYQWEQVNPFEFIRPGYKVLPQQLDTVKGNIKLHNYRFPAQTERRGIVQIIHAYGDHMGMYPHIARKFAKAGYDVVGLDQRGFGHSEGRPGVVENANIMVEDQLRFSEEVDRIYGGVGVPHFLFGHSLGGAISCLMSSWYPGRYRSMALVEPYLELNDPTLLNQLVPLAKFLQHIAPTFTFKDPVDQLQPDWLKEARGDLAKSDVITAQTIMSKIKLLKNLQEGELERVNTPFLMVLGAKDTIICNDKAKQFYEDTKIEDKHFIEYKDVSHDCCFDDEYWPLLTSDTLDFFNARC